MNLYRGLDEYSKLLFQKLSPETWFLDKLKMKCALQFAKLHLAIRAQNINLSIYGGE